jgi:hypothetical protein
MMKKMDGNDKEHNPKKGTIMMKKSFYAGALLLVAATTQAVPPLINGVSLSPYLDEWERTNDILIQKPLEAAKSKKVWSKKAKYAPAIVGGVAGLVTLILAGGARWFDSALSANKSKKRRGGNSGQSSSGFDGADALSSSSASGRRFQPMILEGSDPERLPATVALNALLKGVLVGGAVSGIGYGAMWLQNRYFGFSAMVKEEERAQLSRVLDAWSEVKAYFPKELHKMIEDLLVYRDAKVKDYNTHVDRVIATIRKAVHVHYWEKKKQRPWYE